MTRRIIVQTLKAIPNILILGPLRLLTNLIPYILITTTGSTLWYDKNSPTIASRKRLLALIHSCCHPIHHVVVLDFYLNTLLLILIIADTNDQSVPSTSNLMNEVDCDPWVHDSVARVQMRKQAMDRISWQEPEKGQSVRKGRRRRRKMCCCCFLEVRAKREKCEERREKKGERQQLHLLFCFSLSLLEPKRFEPCSSNCAKHFPHLLVTITRPPNPVWYPCSSILVLDMERLSLACHSSIPCANTNNK